VPEVSCHWLQLNLADCCYVPSSIFSLVTNALSDEFEHAILHAPCARLSILLAVVVQAFAEERLFGHPHIYGWWPLCFLLSEQKAEHMFFSCYDVLMVEVFRQL